MNDFKSGKVRKGGQNSPPETPRPDKPTGQGGAHNVFAALEEAERTIEDLKSKLEASRRKIRILEREKAAMQGTIRRQWSAGEDYIPYPDPDD